MEDRDHYLQTVGRALQILDCFQDTAEWSLSGLAAHLGVNKAVAFRLVSTLRRHGYLEQDPLTKKYRLGERVLILGLAAARRVDLRQVARPVMEWLSQETGESTFLTVERGGFSVCLDKVESSHEIQLMMQVGGVYPLHRGASNKVLLAFQPQSRIEAYLRAIKDQLSADGLSVEEVKAQLQRIREVGYAHSVGEVTPDAFAVGFPVFDGEQRLVGAISSGGPTYRLTPERLRRIVALTQEAAVRVSQRLGGTTPSGESERGATSTEIGCDHHWPVAAHRYGARNGPVAGHGGGDGAGRPRWP